MSRRTSHVTRLTAVSALLVVALSGLSACGSSDGSGSSASGGSTELSLVGYSVPKPAYDALTKAYSATSEGKGVTWKASYGASGDQSRAVAKGQPADYVAFSIEPDLTRLVPKLVDDSWNSGATKGLVSKSVVVIAVRPGNPKNIKTWEDLTKPGVQIVTPDPGSSGSAKWNILGAYSHVLAEGGTEAEAQDYLKAFFANVVSKPESGSKATQTFLNGTGDALISYENEAISTKQKGEKLDYVVPPESILIENPAAVTIKAPKAAKDFLSFVESKDGQKIFAQHGYRPVLDGVEVGDVKGANDPSDPYPTVDKLQTIADLGGWSAVNKKYFDPDSGVVTKIIAGD